MERASRAYVPSNTTGIATTIYTRPSYHLTMISTAYEGEGIRKPKNTTGKCERRTTYLSNIGAAFHLKSGAHALPADNAAYLATTLSGYFATIVTIATIYHNITHNATNILIATTSTINITSAINLPSIDTTRNKISHPDNAARCTRMTVSCYISTVATSCNLISISCYTTDI